MGARGYGRGSVYQRASDGRWLAVLHRHGQRVSFSSLDRDEAEAMLDTYLAEHLPDRVEQPIPRVRAARIAASRDAGHAHTATEWAAKVADADGLCHYCRRPFQWMLHKDHAVPLVRGGSDGIDNLVPACADCNLAKGAMTVDEFLAWAHGSRFFDLPRRVPAIRNGRVALLPRSVAYRNRPRRTWPADPSPLATGGTR